VKPSLPKLANRSPILQNIPLRVVLIAPFLLIVASAIGLSGYSSYRSNNRLIEKLAERLTHEMSDRVEQTLDHKLTTPVSRARQNAAAIRLGTLNWKNPQTLERSFQQQTQILQGSKDEVAGIGLTDEQKNLISVFKPDEQTWVVQLCNASTKSRLITYRVDKDLNRLQELQNIDFDPHNSPPTNPWYPLTKKAGKGTWHLVVTSVVASQPIMLGVFTEPFYDSKGIFQGVTAASIRLTEISKALRQLTPNQDHGQAFIIQRNGLLIATSTEEAPFRLNEKLADRLKPPSSKPPSSKPPSNNSPSNNPSSNSPAIALEAFRQSLQPEQHQFKVSKSTNFLTKEVGQFLNREVGDLSQIKNPQMLSYNYRGDRYFIRVSPLKNSQELDWVVVVVIPESDFAADIKKNIAIISMIYAAAVAGALLSGLLIAEWIAKPVLRLSRASKALMLGKLEEPVQEYSRITELNQLTNSFNQMTEEVLASFDRVKHALQESQEKFTTVFRNSPDPISISSLSDGRLLEVNDSFLAAIGLPEEQVIGKISTELGIWQSVEERLRFMQSIHQTGKAYGYELVSRRASGEEAITLLSSEVIELNGIQCLLSVGKDITDRKRLERELKQSQAKLNDVLNSSTAGICSFRLYPDNHIEYDYISLGHERLFGYTREEFTANPIFWRSHIHPNDLPKTLSTVEQITQPQFTSEYRYQRKDQTWRWIADYLTFRWSGADECWIVTVVSIDITDQKAIADQLHRSEASLLEAQRIAQLGSWEHDLLQNRTTWSAELYRISGIDPANPTEQLLGDLERIHPDDRQSYTALVHQALNSGESYDTDVRILHTDGSTRYINVRGKPVFEQGKCVRLVGTSMDISDRKHAETALQLSEKRFRGAFFSSTIGMCLTSPEGRFLQVNPTLCQMLGYSEAELLNMTYPQVTHRASHQADWDYDQQLLSGKALPYQYEKRYIHKNGQEIWALLHVAVVRDASHQPLYFVAQIQDTTIQKNIEIALKETEARFRAAFDFSHIGLSIISLSGQFIEVNEALCEIYGYSEAELLTMRFHDVTHPEDLAKNLEYFQQSKDGDIQTYSLEKRYIRKDGQIIWGILTAALILDDSGAPLYYVSQVQDITAQKQAQDILRAERDFSRSLIQASPTFFSAIDLSYRTLLINNSMLTALGYTAEEIVGLDYLTTFVPPEHRAAVQLIFERVIKYKERSNSINPVLTKQGQRILVEWRSVPVLNSDGNVQYFFGVGIEVGDRPRAS
jgi:PAS domain S-box-containing protein